MSGAFEARGGARIGWMNATWPLAKLTATSDSLKVEIVLLGNYCFTPETVVSVTRFTRIPVLGWGIRIRHCVAEYPERFIFWCLGDPEDLLAGIRDAGFAPAAPETTVAPRCGIALRWQAIIIGLVVWNGLFALDQRFHHATIPFPGPLAVLAIGLTFGTTITLIRSAAFQQFVLKPGRSIGEIRPFLNLLLFISGVMFAVFALVVAFLEKLQ